MQRTVIARVGLVLTLGCLGGCGQVKSNSNPVASTPASVALPPTDDECQAFAKSLAEIVRSGDIAAFNQAIDWDAVLQQATAGSEDARQFKTGFIKGAKESLANPTSFSGQVISQTQNGGDYRLLRIHAVGDQKRALFRMLGGDSQGVAYHDYLLGKGLDGRVRAVDVFVFMSGELFSQTLRRSYLPLVAESSKNILQRLTQSENVFVKNVKKMEEMTAHLRARRFDKVLEVYHQLPEPLQRDKNFLLMRLMAAQAVGDKEYDQAIQAFRTLLPNEACLDLLLLDGYIMHEQYQEAHACLERLEKAVGGDPYLKVMRANVYGLEKKFEAARQCARQAIEAEDTLVPGYWSLVTIALGEQDFDETSRLLTLLGDKFEVEFADLTTLPEYAEYVKSPQYREWLQQQKEPQPAPTQGPPEPAAGPPSK